MRDDVADALDTDIVLPVSSVKPEYKGPSKLVAWLTSEARTFAGEMILGIRECSRLLSCVLSANLRDGTCSDW
jgi:hypothetical protein